MDHSEDGHGAGGVRFVQSERFSGLLEAVFKRLMRLGPKTVAGFEAMNAALKARAEGPPP